ncbi:uncharacterized protein B0H18DRAFT_1007640 [Fomitopsis serialis]|uniref:uncharacterized protein n=1 Tax=Fomitopsis serialis TaxID=139415 RepID=UPI0020077A61|nr:uncharacterized protein B0H18DRAFT_1007640 [Neoantrodia serialis]KAH9926035.1 hypothetical protein B0H18DRAFT_1007640 [Neoantrodia serialis]
MLSSGCKGSVWAASCPCCHSSSVTAVTGRAPLTAGDAVSALGISSAALGPASTPRISTSGSCTAVGLNPRPML